MAIATGRICGLPRARPAYERPTPLAPRPRLLAPSPNSAARIGRHPRRGVLPGPCEPAVGNRSISAPSPLARRRLPAAGGRGTPDVAPSTRRPPRAPGRLPEEHGPLGRERRKIKSRRMAGAALELRFGGWVAGAADRARFLKKGKPGRGQQEPGRVPSAGADATWPRAGTPQGDERRRAQWIPRRGMDVEIMAPPAARTRRGPRAHEQPGSERTLVRSG